MAGKPEDIPQEVWDEAVGWVEAMAMWAAMPEAKGTQYRESMFARAIVNATKAEREACASVASATSTFEWRGGEEWAAGYSDGKNAAAAAIRKRGGE